MCMSIYNSCLMHSSIRVVTELASADIEVETVGVTTTDISDVSAWPIAIASFCFLFIIII